MKKDLKEKITNSGNNLHIWVADTLKRRGWENIDLGSYYYDDTLPKPREIDIIAKHRVEDFEATKISIDKKFDVNLFIECKHFLSDIGFRQYEVNEEDREKAILIEQFAILEGSKTTKGRVEGAILPVHPHYKKEKIGKLYDTSNKNKDGGQDLLFDAITQPIKSYIFNEPYLLQGISFLIVVYENIDGIYELNGQDYTDDFLDGLKPNKTSTLGIKYSYREQRSGDIRQNRNFFIDFVHKDEFESYLQKNVMPVVRSLAFAMIKI